MKLHAHFILMPTDADTLCQNAWCAFLVIAGSLFSSLQDGCLCMVCHLLLVWINTTVCVYFCCRIWLILIYFNILNVVCICVYIFLLSHFRDFCWATIDVCCTCLLLVAWHSGNALCRINEVTLWWARLVLGWVTVWAGKPSQYEASQLGRLSLLPSMGW